jgi:hypothetical protein
LAEHFQQLGFGALLFLAQEIKKDFFLVPEVGKHRPGAYPCPSGNIAGGGAMKPIPKKEVEGGVGYGFALLPAQLRITNQQGVSFVRA